MTEPSLDVTKQRDAYGLGHSDQELERLKAQARLYEPISRQFFRDAGIAPGMRVLDVGSGRGDVTFLVADMIGRAGEVIGIDKAPAAMATARARMNPDSCPNVSFCEGDATEMAFERPFDAIVGRFVLMHIPDRVATVRRLAGHLRTGGLMVFHELDYHGVQSFPPAPTYDRCLRWIVEAFRRLGAETQMGVKLHSVFVGAGLPPPSMRLEAMIGGAEQIPARLHALTETVRSLLPSIVQSGVATATEVGIETLADRLHDEVVGGGCAIVGPSHVGAWSTKQ